MTSLTPDERESVGPLFQELVARPWFNRNAITEGELLKFLLRAHRQGEMNDVEGIARCRATAMERFARIR